MALTMPWGEQVTVTMAVGFLVNKFTLNDPILGLLDGTGVLDGNLEGIDVTEWVQEVSFTRGRNNELDAFEAGVAYIKLLNNDRRFDPINESSPYWDATTNRSGVQPRRRVTISSDGELLFVGAITDIAIDYDGDLSTASFTCSDDFVLLSNTTIETSFTPPVEISGTRIASILDLPEVGFPADDRNIATGGQDMGAYEVTAGTNVLQYLQKVAQSDQAFLFMSRDGLLTYTDPLESIWYYDVQADFTDFQDPLPIGSIAYTSIRTITDQTYLYNKVITSITGGADNVADDTDSQDAFGISTLSLTDLLLDQNSEAVTVAETLLEKYALPLYRFDDLTFVINGMSTANRQSLCQLDLVDGVRVTRTFAVGTPATVEGYYQVEQVQHTITPNSHSVTIRLGDLKTVIYPFTLSDPTYGTLDSGNALV